eukprot:gene7468-10179_t
MATNKSCLKINQDRACIVHPYNSNKNEYLFVVLDGHGSDGEKVSEFAMRQVLSSLEYDSSILLSNPEIALKNSFLVANSNLKNVQTIEYGGSGSTCIVVYLRKKDIYVANVGDSRAVIGYRNDLNKIIAKDLSRDHKPDDPDENERIVRCGGFVCPPPFPGHSARVYKDAKFLVYGLAMSRSIGDFDVKKIGVIAEPEISTFNRNESDVYMIIATDGVWEFISSQEAVDIVDANIEKGVDFATRKLIEIASMKWAEDGYGSYRDDITAIVFKFPQTIVN